MLLLVVVVCIEGNTESSCSLDKDGSCLAANTECSLYIAKSSIPNAGLGIYAGKDYQKGDTIPGDLCIPIIDSTFHSRAKYNPYHDYTWDGRSMGMQRESLYETAEALCFGLDAAVNGHIGMVNVHKGTPLYRPNNATLDTTPYSTGSSLVTMDVPRGTEFFKFYGDSWFTGRKEYGNIPLSQDYAVADRILQNLKFLPSSFFGTVIQIRDIWDSRILNAFPDESSLSALLNPSTPFSLRSYVESEHSRSMEWLVNHGRCMDNIRIDSSTTLPNQRGALANRFMPKGSVVATSPVLHLDENFYPIYNLTRQEMKDSNSSSLYRSLDKPVTYQMALNYVYQHPKSSLVFHPYSSVVNAINHHDKNSNVHIRWADGFDGHNSTALLMTTTELKEIRRSMLSMEYVASRDIFPDEEIFLDYGQAWKDSWEQHVGLKKENAAHDTEVHDMPQINEHILSNYLKVQHGNAEGSEWGQFQVRCHTQLVKINKDWPSEFVWDSNNYGLACRILDSVHLRGKTVYTVKLESVHSRQNENYYHHVRIHVPIQAIRLYQKPTHSNLMKPNTFRHPIGLPEALIPENWKDKRN